MPPRPLVTIVVPAFNAAQFLTETLQCIADQSFTNWEAVIVDDESTDDTSVIAEGFASKDSRFRLVHQANQGQGEGRNMGIRCSDRSSTFFCFIDADDLWTNDALESMLACVGANSNCIGVSVVGHYISTDGKPFDDGVLENICRNRRVLKNGRLVRLRADEPTTFACLAVTNCIPTSAAVMIRRSALIIPDPYPKGMRIAEDYYQWLIASRNGDFAFLDRSILSYRRHAENMSKDVKAMRMGHVRMSEAILQSDVLSNEKRWIFMVSQPSKILLLMALRALLRGYFGRSLRLGGQAFINLWRFKIAPRFQRCERAS